MKKDLIKLIKKYLTTKGYNRLYLYDTPFGKYSEIERIILSQTNELFIILTNNINQNILLNNLINLKNEEYFMDLFLTIYDKIKEIEQSNN